MLRDVTLREAFDELRRNKRQFTSGAVISNDSGIFFDRHDVAHVIFGCDASLRGEGIVKLWTILGTTSGLVDHLTAYSEANSFDSFQKYSAKHVLANIQPVIFAAPLVITRAHKMTKKWP